LPKASTFADIYYFESSEFYRKFTNNKSAKSISSSIFNFEEELLMRKEPIDSKFLSIYGQQ